MYWLVFRLVPVRLLFGIAALVVGTQMMGFDLVTPVLDWLANQFADWTSQSLWDSLKFW